jgi:hypothetical protein
MGWHIMLILFIFQKQYKTINVLKQFYLASVILLLTNICTAQQGQNSSYKKGQLFFNWGWNRAAYTKSTLQMKGADYNLTLHKLTANDRLTPISFENYLQIDRITIPQTNMRIGYFIKNNLAIVLAIDHMKYVMNQDQIAEVEGEINREGVYKKSFSGSMKITEDFLTFEHTDGLNYVNIGAEVYQSLFKNKKKTIDISYIYGANIGAMVPKTNVKFLDYERTDRFHLSGFGIEAKNAVQAKFFKHWLVRMEAAVGFIDMPNIILHKTGVQGRGKQNFAFAQLNWEIGYQFKL